MRQCYYCGRPVSPEEWHQVMDVTEFWMTLDDSLGLDNLFVHMVGAQPHNLDKDGNVVVCARDAIREMHESMANIEKAD